LVFPPCPVGVADGALAPPLPHSRDFITTINARAGQRPRSSLRGVSGRSPACGCKIALEETGNPRRISGTDSVLQQTVPYNARVRLRHQEPPVEILTHIDLPPIRHLTIEALVNRQFGRPTYFIAQVLIFSVQSLEFGRKPMLCRPNSHVKQLAAEV